MALSGSHCSEEEGDIDNFLPVITTIDLEALASAALKARIGKSGNVSTSSSSETTRLLSCSIQTPPWTGSYNIAWAINFSDDVRWIAHVPGCGVESFGPLEKRRFLTNIWSMAFIRSATTIPIPEVFKFEATAENPVKVPYRLEAFVEGKHLSEVWNDPSWSSEGKRLKTIRNLATVMSQLHVLTFDKIGGLNFDDDGRFSHVGEAVYLEQDWDKIMDGEEVWGTAKLAPPSNTNKEDLLQDLEDSVIPTEQAPQVRADYEIIRLAIESLPESQNTDGAFALGHPDFNYQNIFVDDEGKITGIIDWDGMWTRPRALGFARYPSWITRDWDPVKYGYGMEDCKEDSPDQLLSYRREYAATFAELKIPGSYYSPNDTKLSQIIEAISLAISDEISRPWILMILLKWAFNDRLPFELTIEPRPEEYYKDQNVPREWIDATRQFSELYLADKAGAWIEAIKDAFSKMWHSEWDD